MSASTTRSILYGALIAVLLASQAARGASQMPPTESAGAAPFPATTLLQCMDRAQRDSALRLLYRDQRDSLHALVEKGPCRVNGLG